MAGRDQFDFDVVIAGGGPAGCATALSLAAAGVERVLVVESGAYETERIGESVPPDTRQWLAALGLLDDFVRQGHRVCLGSCSSWGGDELGVNDYLFNPYGHGWHLDRRRFDAWLCQQARAAGVDIVTRTKLEPHIRATEGGVELELTTEGTTRSVRARFVIDASGERASFARARGARRVEYDRLVVSSVHFERVGNPFPELTVLEAVEDGWWYAARLPRQRAIVAFATSHSSHKQLGVHAPRQWLEALGRTQHVWPLLNRTLAVPTGNGVQSRLAPSFLLDRLYGTSPEVPWLAVGDAACCYDPLSSQGIYKALQDGVSAGRAVSGHLRGDGAALERHAAVLRDRFERYLVERRRLYAREQRFAASQFWGERASAEPLTRASSPSPNPAPGL